MFDEIPQKDYFISNLLKWGEKNLRIFEWRYDKTPYKVLISEIMLQRTSAFQVKLIFSSFIKKYPNIKELSQSDTEELTEIIKPLGLHQRRVKVFQTVAQQIEDDFNGNIPNEYDDLIGLFGIGKYIANAILCFNYNECVPIVDTNIIRILQRFYNFKSDKNFIISDKKIWEFAKRLIPDANCELYNYSLLDFGSLVCKPKNPECNKCILNEECYYLNLKEDV